MSNDNKNTSSISSGFRRFLLRDNVIGMAIGLVVGSAFSNIIRSFVDNLINPFLSIILNHVNFSQKVLQVGEGQNIITVKWGQFLSDIINFLILAFIVYLIIWWLNKTLAKDPKERFGYSAELDELKEIRKIMAYQTLQQDKDRKEREEQNYDHNENTSYRH
ncbi:large conductance mechanosensitive channel protein MscL [Xylocopilactobacillus apicola]|uniref:Large-conductance mechanosensitive channel n=1 Tax=Xylocopilactobacillus apicola TaxID=2932184 RepID=A0AAU9D9T1_9LACO|nr:large conductance mechanosensitive channel protein MscL [Xylocopilactobacillus apicola]BDR58255.1 large-conductance mechanosensitive channel [Xylocopilactobacillus apicola]